MPPWMGNVRLKIHREDPQKTKPSHKGDGMARILAIDDEQSIAELIQETLTVCGHTVDIAVAGHQGLQLFDADHFDLVITDMCLPDITGDRILGHIRRSHRPTTPVVGISGTPWLLNGADFDASLTKPFSLTVLIDAVSGLLSHGAAFKQANDVFTPPLQAVNTPSH